MEANFVAYSFFISPKDELWGAAFHIRTSDGQAFTALFLIHIN